jgi:hypothetical protein
MEYRFRNCALDTARFALCRDGHVIDVEPQVVKLLKYLIENRDRVVPRSELLERMFGRCVVTDNALRWQPDRISVEHVNESRIIDNKCRSLQFGIELHDSLNSHTRDNRFRFPPGDAGCEMICPGPDISPIRANLGQPFVRTTDFPIERNT